MGYENLIIEIGRGEGKEYPLKVSQSPAGEGNGILLLPFDDAGLNAQLLTIQNAVLRVGGNNRDLKLLKPPLSPKHDLVKEFGRKLFESLMTGQILTCYDKSRQYALDAHKGLRLILRINSPRLVSLPWEFLYDEREDSYLALDLNTPIVRYPELLRTITPITVNPPLRILGMIATPKDTPYLDAAKEKRRMEEALATVQKAGLVELTWIQRHTWQDLHDAIGEGIWHVFHFIGHSQFDVSTDRADIVLADEQNHAYYLPATKLATLLAGIIHPPRLVLLNSCEGASGNQVDLFASTASILVRRGIPAVVAMQLRITDSAAIVFSKEFYEAIAKGWSIEAAISDARRAIYLSAHDTFEWGTPTLYTHAPDGVLFHIQQQKVSEPIVIDRQGKTEEEAQLGILPAESGEVFWKILKDEHVPEETLFPFQKEGFIGRTKEIDKFRKLLRQDQIVIIKGMAGVGKTTLGTNLAFAEAKPEERTVLFTLRESDDRDICWVLALFLKNQGQPDLWNYLKTSLKVDLEVKLYHLRKGLSSSKYLLCFDNIESVLKDDFFSTNRRSLSRSVATTSSVYTHRPGHPIAPWLSLQFFAGF